MRITTRLLSGMNKLPIDCFALGNVRTVKYGYSEREPDSCAVLDPPLPVQIRVMAISVPPDSCGVLDPPLLDQIRVMAIFVPPDSCGVLDPHFSTRLE
ncbi:hypothetical protein RRG08_039256 [Elysia crispata]|uniref:Uncharacterized protein n=1 Tax=Elysia crispata TaxID=231223 RepID=A0AAE0ZQ53_9GAST|nr:hypothetical protein RRG08_039256 [Elysia crispata]